MNEFNCACQDSKVILAVQNNCRNLMLPLRQCVPLTNTLFASLLKAHAANQSRKNRCTGVSSTYPHLRHCSVRLEQLAIQRHCITDIWHLQAPAEDTSFCCFPCLTHPVLNLRCTVFFLKR